MDINPDTILNDHYEMYIVDIDADGHNDFDFYNLSYMHYGFYASGDHNEFRQRIIAGVRFFGDMEFNGIVGTFDTRWAPYDFYYQYFVSELSDGMMINNEIHFNPWVAQVMAWRDYLPGILSTGDTLFLGAFENGQWIDDVEDKYMGIKFRAGDDSIHYGWIRCSVKDDGKAGFQLIIKDYAYELTPNAPILASDTIGGLPVPVVLIQDEAIPIGEVIITGINSQNFEAISIYSFGKTIFIQLSDGLGNQSQAKILELQGRLLISKSIHSDYTEITVDIPEGIYVVNIQTGEGSATCKVFIDK